MTKTRNEVIAEVAAWAAGQIKSDIDATNLATQLVDEKDVHPGDDLNLEIPSRYTLSGNPAAGTFEAPAAE